MSLLGLLLLALVLALILSGGSYQYRGSLVTSDLVTVLVVVLLIVLLLSLFGGVRL